MFTPEVSEQLKYYVYRLIDPRNGETFYVGKGTGNRVFAHIKDALGADADTENDKLKRIKEIKLDGHEVSHVIHRHGLEENTAFEVEAALIDAYPETTNIVSGHSDDRGLMHSKQIIEHYSAEEIEFKHKVIIINVNSSVTEQESVYEAVRYAWKIDPKKAQQAELVLASVQGLIKGVFVVDEWIVATSDNFPSRTTREGRWGFNGREAPKDKSDLYLHHRIPANMKKQGAANPIRYVL